MSRLCLFLTFLLAMCQVGWASWPDGRTGGRDNGPIINQFEHLSVRNGLSNNWVNCILQDREGFMWFGTNDGLNKYDGYAFTVLQPNPSDSAHTFRNNQISGLFEDHAGRLWAITEGGGLHEVDKRTGEVTPHPIRASRANRWNYQHTLYEDRAHALWISTLGGLARYEPDRDHFTLYPLPQPLATIKTVFEDPQGHFWVATFQGLFLLNRKTGRYTPVMVEGETGTQPAIMAFYLDPMGTIWLATATAGYALLKLNLHRHPFRLVPYNPGGQLNPFVYLNALHRDRRGYLWVGTTNGLHAIDPTNDRVFTYHPDPSNPKGLASNNIQAIYHDRTGLLWVGTDNGIDRQAVSDGPFSLYQIKPNSGTVNLPENRSVAMLMDAYNRLWISTLYATYRTEAELGPPKQIPPDLLGSGGEQKNGVYDFLPEGPTGIWLGSAKGLYRYDETTKRFILYPSAIPVEFLDRSPTGEIWFGGDQGIGRFDPKTRQYQYHTYSPHKPGGLPDQYVYGILVSRSGEVWVLFRTQGILRLNPRTGKRVRHLAGSPGQPSTNDILTLYEDESGVVWLGTQRGGLNRYDPKTNQFSVVTTREGLLSNTIMAITGDGRGQLWLSTDRGLCRFDPQTRTVRNFRTIPGLPDNGFLRNSVFRSRDRLYFGSLNGIVHVDPTAVGDSTQVFAPHITELTVMNRLRPLPPTELTLDYDENFISFGFSTLTYAQPEQTQFGYQLMGVDDDWIDNGNRHFANYTDLAPGRYTFRVRAANGDGVWMPHVAAIDVTIRPPWWQTNWAYSLYTILAIGLLAALGQFYTERIRQQQTLAFNRREAENLKEVDELKTRFFTNITHEFRTPLSLILSPTEKLLADSDVGGTLRQTLILIHRNADHLLRLINQLMDLAKVEANRMTVELTRGDVQSFVGNVVEASREQAEKHGIRLLYEGGQSDGDALFDADKWEKIVTNLLSNALKFTPEGGEIRVCLSPVETEPSACQIEVTDTGIGIAPEHLPRIFDRFYQQPADSSSMRAYGGTGIGLSLVRELVELLQGRISVESQPGFGTTFRVVLPIEQPVHSSGAAPVRVTIANPAQRVDAPPLSMVAPPALAAGREKPPILVVEDNDELRGFLVRELADRYRVLEAADGETGWQLAQNELPNVVVSDVMMPRMDGFALTRLLKSHADTNHIAVILLTAKVTHQSRMEGLQEGADEYLTKPFHLDELQLLLRNVLAQQARLRDHYRRELMELETAEPNVGSDNEFLQRTYQMLEMHLSNSALDVDWLADQLAMSRKTLYRKTHTLLHLAPNELIRTYRLRRAVELLRAGHSVAQTAYRVGYRTPAHFTTAFKEVYGKTPRAFIQDL